MMLNKELAEDYLNRAKIRFRLLQEFLKERDYADVIRVSQEIVELAQKSILIKININPPKWHEVIDIILENRERLPGGVIAMLSKLRRDSKWLRSQRELSFYGDADFIPSKNYSLRDAKKAISIAEKFLNISKTI